MKGYEYHYQNLRSILSKPFLPILKEKYFPLRENIFFLKGMFYI